ncbi:ribonuclease H-like domain-containing protein [Tanacetum coccineum]
MEEGRINGNELKTELKEIRQKEWDNPPNIISEQEVANLKAQAKRLFGNEDVWVEMHRGIAWDKVENSDPQSTPQVLPSFEEYTLPVTCPEEVKETLGTPIEVEPLDETQLEDLGLNTCNHDIPLSNREVPSFDEPEPQPNPLPNCLSLDVSLGEERAPEPPIKPHSLDSFRMKEIDSLTINTPPSSHVASFPRKVVCDCRVEAVTFIPYTLATNFPITVQIRFPAICKNAGVTDLVSRGLVIENKNDVFPDNLQVNLEDVFSSISQTMFLGFTDYIPTYPGKTYSSVSNTLWNCLMPPKEHQRGSNCYDSDAISARTGPYRKLCSKKETTKSSLAVNLSTLMVRKEQGSHQHSPKAKAQVNYACSNASISDNKRKFDDKKNLQQSPRNNNNYRNTKSLQQSSQQNRRQETGRAYAVTPSENGRYVGDLPLCKRCNFHHNGPCTGKCNICNKVGHLSKNCRNKKPATGSNQLPVTVYLYAVGKRAFYKSVAARTNIYAQGKSLHAEGQECPTRPNVVRVICSIRPPSPQLSARTLSYKRVRERLSSTESKGREIIPKTAFRTGGDMSKKVNQGVRKIL